MIRAEQQARKLRIIAAIQAGDPYLEIAVREGVGNSYVAHVALRAGLGRYAERKSNAPRTVVCKPCGEAVPVHRIGWHRRSCGAAIEQLGAAPQSTVVDERGLEPCPCGRGMKAKGAETCFRCEDLDPRFAELDRLIAGGRRHDAERVTA